MQTLQQLVERFAFRSRIPGVCLARPAAGPLVIPGLELAGWLEGHPPGALLLFTPREAAYLRSLEPREALDRLEALVACGPAAILTLGELAPSVLDLLEAVARPASLPLLTAPEQGEFDVCDLRWLLAAPDRSSRVISGTMMEVHGLGVVVTGESGVGKSECALELIRRGHRLVADDVIQLLRLPGLRLEGSMDELIGHHMEIRGIGIIDVRALFGVAAVLPYWPVDLVIRLRSGGESGDFDRLGVEGRSIELLGVPVTELEIPVRSGRNLAIEVEVAVLNEVLKRQGHHSARRFLRGLMEKARGGREET